MSTKAAPLSVTTEDHCALVWPGLVYVYRFNPAKQTNLQPILCVEDRTCGMGEGEDIARKAIEADAKRMPKLTPWKRLDVGAALVEIFDWRRGAS
jgi:hypothetical protein